MLIYHIFLLLLSWPCARAIEDEKPPPDESPLDQIATASENQRIPFVQFDDTAITSKTTETTTTQSPIVATTIYYENSNGFVPMDEIIPENPELTEFSDFSEINTTPIDDSNDNDDDESIDTISRDFELIDDDPAYSTEARMFMNLAGPNAQRRSFDTQQDAPSEFEILKVNNETPAIANYHDFYENIQSNLNRNRATANQARYEEMKETAAPGGRTNVQNKRTKERIKKIEKYLTNFQANENQDNTYKQYYNGYPSGNARPPNTQKDIFEPEKVQTTFNQPINGQQIYDVYSDTSSRPKTSSIPRSGYDDATTNTRQKYSMITGKNRNSKPVVVIEPSDYKIDGKYANQQVTTKFSTNEHQRSSKQRKEPTEIELPIQHHTETSVNGEDRYGHSYERAEDNDDYSEESDDYLEITEKPRRIYKSRRRPYSSENSRKLPKEHRGHVNSSPELQDSRKNNSPTRAKLHRPKSKPTYWIEDDRTPASEEISEEQQPNIIRPSVSNLKSEDSSKQNYKTKGVTNWSQIGPNIEVSHSNGFEIDQNDKPKILVPVNLNLLPISNFDHSTAIGNSQGFDLTNVPNYVTATSIASSQSPLPSTGQSLINSGQGNNGMTAKNAQSALNNNYGLSTAVPDIIVGQNTYQNSVQAVLLPHMNVNPKFASNLRSHYSASTVAPMFTVTQTLNPNLQNIGPTMSSSQPLQNFQTTPSSRPAESMSQNLHHFTVNPSVSPTIPQLLLPQSTLQSFPLLHSSYPTNSNYNILVNPNGLHGQNFIQHSSAPSGTGQQNFVTSTTTPQPNTSNNNFPSAETQVRKNFASNSNGQFVTSASFSVGNETPQEQTNNANNKYYLSTNNQNLMNNNNNNANNNNYYNGNQNNQQMPRPQGQENFYQIYGDDQNSKIKTYLQTAQVVPAIIHHGNGIPMNFNNPNYANIDGQLQGQHSILNPSVIANRPRDQNQQILKAANDIFENTWKQLQQLQSNDDAARRSPYQNVYRINDNIGSTSNTNGNTVNSLSGHGVNSAKAHLPILPTQNVEIINPNMKPSPIDYTLLNPYESMNHYPAAVLTTPIPIFSTTANFLVPRPAYHASTTPATINLQNYVDQLTQIGASQNNQANKLQPVVVRNQDNQRHVFNPIQFVPNLDLMKSQSMLNSKYTEPLPNQLNLVPVIPGGNFFKNSHGAQTELVKKPRLSSDLEKYAEEMFKESLKTIYSTHKWNNDRKLRGNYSSTEMNDLAKLKSELQRFRASMPDPKYTGTDELEGHHSETKLRTAEPAGRPTKKPELSIAEIEQLFKSDFKLNLPSSSSGESSSHHHGHETNHHQKNRPGHSSSRPAGSSSEQYSTDFRNMKHLSDYLTPPRLNSFVSKSPFVDSPKSAKKRPGTNASRYKTSNGNTMRQSSRPNSHVSRPSSSPDVSASNHVESGIKADSHSRHHKRPGKYSRDNNDNYDANRYSSDHTDYRSYPTFTTTSSSDGEHYKQSSSEQFSKSDYYDINHPRMHNLLGLLMKNKQLPKGSSKSFFRDDDDLRQFFDSENRRIHSEFYDGRTNNVQNKLHAPINMGPPAASNLPQIQYFPGQGAT